MRVEVTNIPSSDEKNKSGPDALRNFLEGEPGYLSYKTLTYDEIYIKNYIN